MATQEQIEKIEKAIKSGVIKGEMIEDMKKKLAKFKAEKSDTGKAKVTKPKPKPKKKVRAKKTKPANETSGKVFKVGEELTDKDGTTWDIWKVIDNIPFALKDQRVYGSGSNRQPFYWFAYYDQDLKKWKSHLDPLNGYSEKRIKEGYPWIFEEKAKQDYYKAKDGSQYWVEKDDISGDWQVIHEGTAGYPTTFKKKGDAEDIAKILAKGQDPDDPTEKPKTIKEKITKEIKKSAGDQVEKCKVILKEANYVVKKKTKLGKDGKRKTIKAKEQRQDRTIIKDRTEKIFTTITKDYNSEKEKEQNKELLNEIEDLKSLFVSMMQSIDKIVQDKDIGKIRTIKKLFKKLND